MAAPLADVYHGHDLTGLPAALTAAGRNDAPVVYDSHEIFLEAGSTATRPGWARALFRRLEARWVARTAALVTVNWSLEEVLGGRYHPARTVVVHNCPSRWDPPSPPRHLLRTALGLPSDTPVALYHGGFSAHRGLEELAEAILLPGLERVHAVYLGYGSRRDWLLEQELDPRFGGRLNVIAAVPPDRLADWVVDADVGVMPIQSSTLNHAMSTPNKLFECLAAGVPVVVSDFPEMHRIVLDDPDGPLGAVCRPDDPADVARAIRSVLDLPPAERADLRRRCLKAAHERWNWESESARLVELYADLTRPVAASAASHGARVVARMTEGSPEGVVRQRAVLVLPTTAEYDSRTYRIASALAARGHDVAVLARWRPGLPEDEVHPAGYRIRRVKVSAGAGLPIPGPIYRWISTFRRRRREKAAAVGAGASASVAASSAPRPPADLEAEPIPRRRGLVGRLLAVPRAAWRIAAIGLVVRSQTKASRHAVSPADLYHGMAYMGIPVALDLARPSRRQGRLRRARHLRRCRQSRPPAAARPGGRRSARAWLGSTSESGRSP